MGDVHRVAIAALSAPLALMGCGRPFRSVPQLATDARVATAERFVDAFYSFDRRRLASTLAMADSSAPRIIYYQGWAEGGSYRIRRRMPCEPEPENRVRCAITVEDDLIRALGLQEHVTDTFRLAVTGGHVRHVTTSSNDPPLFEEALAWVRRERADRIRVPCQGFFAGGPTPQACVRVIVQGFSEFAALRRQPR
jgi:hypothetical protein